MMASPYDCNIFERDVQQYTTYQPNKEDLVFGHDLKLPFCQNGFCFGIRLLRGLKDFAIAEYIDTSENPEGGVIAVAIPVNLKKIETEY